MAVFVACARVSRPVQLIRLAATIALLVSAVACATGGAKKPPTGTPEPDKFLFERGTEELNKRRWLVSREYFRQLFDSYPQSQYRADAKLGIGDTYLGEGSAESFVLAINEFREFLNFYPTHGRADYAQFKLGMAHYYQMRAPERDQTESREAVRELQTFVTRYPNSSLKEEGQKRLRDAKDRLGDSEYRVGYFYFRSRWYPGAVDRLKSLIDRDPGYTRRDAAYFYLAESLVKLSKPKEALPYFDRLVKEFEQSEYLAAAQKRIEELKAAPAKGNGGIQ
jgi:outer membrane protein assembly factor BamD